MKGGSLNFQKEKNNILFCSIQIIHSGFYGKKTKKGAPSQLSP